MAFDGAHIPRRIKIMKFNIEFSTDNAAFEDDTDGAAEAIRILRHVIECIRDDQWNGTCRDINGNVVGSFGVRR